MSLRLRVAASAVFFGLCAVSLPPAARAQGFFSSLFGWGGGAQAPAAPPPAARPALPPGLPPTFGHRAPPHFPSARSREDDGPRERGGNYRTMCVRLCDGYYWPISSNVGRSRFYRDAQACRASCGDEARLFFHAASSGDASDMVDQQGRAYSSLPNAFRYRKKLVDGCRCKPEPWSDSELNRHRMYAMNETIRRRVEAEEAGDVVAGGAQRPAGVIVAGEYKQEQWMPAVPQSEEVEVRDEAEGDSATAAAPPPPVTAVAASPRAPATAGRRSRASQPQLASVRKPAQAQSARPTRAVAKAPASAPFGLGGPGAGKRWPGD